jgi:hypothetical protein
LELERIWSSFTTKGIKREMVLKMIEEVLGKAKIVEEVVCKNFRQSVSGSCGMESILYLSVIPL